MKRIILLLACVVLLSSHELFLKTKQYFLNPFTKSELFLYNGTFDSSENTITRDRILNAVIIGPEYEFRPNEKDYYDQNNITYLKYTTGKEGNYVAGISTFAREIDLSDKEFNDYLLHEGLHQIIEQRKEKGISTSPVRELYSKHVKALIQVGKEHSDHYKTVLNYPIEFIPHNNPNALHKGDKFIIKLLFNGMPLANQIVHYSVRSIAGNKPIEEHSTKTDESGFFSLVLNQPGKWYVASIHMTESEEKELDYVSNWATLTFEIK